MAAPRPRVSLDAAVPASRLRSTLLPSPRHDGHDAPQPEPFDDRDADAWLGDDAVVVTPAPMSFSHSRGIERMLVRAAEKEGGRRGMDG